MAKHKKDIKPLFDVKHDFIDSLENYVQAGLAFRLTVQTALQLNQIAEPSATAVREALETLEKATDSSEY